MTFYLGYLKYVKVEELTDDDKQELLKQLQDHKSAIETALKSVDDDIKALSKPKRATRRRPPPSGSD